MRNSENEKLQMVKIKEEANLFKRQETLQVEYN